jgi:CRP-like cAMP-binding protein
MPPRMKTQPIGSPEAIKAALKRAYLFSKVGSVEIDAISGMAEWASVPDKTVLVKEGENSRSLYVLAKGKLVVKETVTQNMELIIARITPGDVVGEVGFVDKKPASATVRADGPCEMVRLDYLSLKDLFEQRPELERAFYRDLCRTLAERLRAGNAALRRSMLNNNAALGYY